MKHTRFLFIVTCFWHYPSAHADNLLTFFLNPYPTEFKQDQCENILQTLKEPGRLAEYCVYGFFDKKLIVGVFATYAGYLSISDEIGQITFPLLHTKNTVQVLVTNRLTPIMMLGNTLHHWELTADVPATLYTFTKEYDAESQLNYWDVQPEELPKNRIIPVETVVILAKPQYIFVPQGATPIDQKTPHYVLPNIYVKRGINVTGNALYMLNLNNFYAPIKEKLKLGPMRYMRLLNT